MIINVFVYYHIRFRPANVKEVIQKVLEEFLYDKQYSPEQVEGWTKEISDSIKSKVKGRRQTEVLMLNVCVYIY